MITSLFDWSTGVDRHVTDDNAWRRTVDQLDTACAHQLTAHVRHIVDTHESSRLSSADGDVVIALLDRASPKTATVSWSDPQGGKYGEQVWRLATARRPGVCALSGKPIASGDAIYRPTKVEPPPANAAAMMLAVVVERALAD